VEDGLYVIDDLMINSEASITCSAVGESGIALGGNWTNNGTFTAETSVVVFTELRRYCPARHTRFSYIIIYLDASLTRLQKCR
jgi:hypothetical protein